MAYGKAGTVLALPLGRLRLPLRRQQMVVAHQPQHAPHRRAHLAHPQPRLHLAVGFAMEGRLLDVAPDLDHEVFITRASLGATAGGRRQRGWQRCSQKVDRGRPHAFSTREAPAGPPCGGRAGAAHLARRPPQKSLKSSMRRMRSRSSSICMARSAMNRLCRLPCSPTRSCCRILSPSAPAARRASSESVRAAGVPPYLRLVGFGSAPRSGARTTLVLRLAGRAALAAAAGFRLARRSPSGSLKRARKPKDSCWASFACRIASECPTKSCGGRPHHDPYEERS